LAEAFGFFDGEQELLFELIVAFVWRQVESIEACVRSRQPRFFADFLDAKLLRTGASFKI
jgi:hypothetical protein